MQSPAVRVRRAEAESARRRLLEGGFLRHGLRVRREGGDILFPVTAAPPGFPAESVEFEASAAPRTYRDVARVPEGVRDLLPTSYDQVGDILLLKLPEPLIPHAAEVGRALLQVQRNARVVCLDGGVKGAFRVREVRVIAGEARTDTVHREHGMRLRVDVGRAFYTPRLGTERLRVARLVRPGETVVDLFAGVGPLALLVARLVPTAKVLAVDANPEAFRFLEENVRLNRAGSVTAVREDAGSVLARLRDADRIVMDLPHGALPFLPAAIRALARGGTVHFYAVLETADRDATAAALEQAGTVEGREASVAGIRLVHAYSATQGLFAFDLAVG
jgi:tRNA (guanine37-N1)-methyltransferase